MFYSAAATMIKTAGKACLTLYQGKKFLLLQKAEIFPKC